jgi:hypothetical protein
MMTPSGKQPSQGSVLDPHIDLGEGGPRLADYLLKSTQELDSITELVCRREVIGRDSRDWMLAQVDFIIETIGNESLELADDMRSKLLQLLLAIANLNEQIRRQASLEL